MDLLSAFLEPSSFAKLLGESTSHEAWLLYFNTLALTITAGSTLLVAVAVIRIQSLDSALKLIEHSIAGAFYKAGKLNDYSQTVRFVLNEQWSEYFTNVRTLASFNHDQFSRDKSNYSESKHFVDSIIAQGERLARHNATLRRSLIPTFLATAAVAGSAVLVLPAVNSIATTYLFWLWIASAIVSIALLMFFAVLLKRTF